MKDDLVISDRSAFLVEAGSNPDRHPALVYLASLSSEGSRRTMRWALNTMMDHFELNRQEAKGLMGCYWRGLVDVLVELPDGLTILRPEDTLNRGEQ